MKYSEALKKGWKEGRVAWARGYISRKVNQMDQLVYRSARGEYYVELPSWQSSQYFHRQYLTPPCGGVNND